MSEANLRKLFKDNVPGHLFRVENSVVSGGPDTNYCIAGVEGWVEFKWLEAYPARPTTVIRIPHFMDAQRLWLKARWKAGGRCFVFIRIADDFYLFDGLTAADRLGVDICSPGLVALAVGWWPRRRVDWKQFVQLLRK